MAAVTLIASEARNKGLPLQPSYARLEGTDSNVIVSIVGPTGSTDPKGQTGAVGSTGSSDFTDIDLYPPPSYPHPDDVKPLSYLHPEASAQTSANAQIIIHKPEYKTMLDVRNLVTNDELGVNNPTYLSTALDILAVYIKGQKILYTEAKVYCEQQLNMLMLPAIFISSLCTLLSLALQSTAAGPYVVSGFTAVNSFILALISYLKLDGKAEAHKTSAYQYDKLRTICEFNSGKIMFFIKKEDWTKAQENIAIVVDDIQKKLEEIKDTNKFILPQYIRHHFKKLNAQNLFSDVKTLQLRELELLTDLKRIENDMIDIESRIKLIETNAVVYDPVELQKDIQYRWDRRGERDEKRKEIIRHRILYLKLEDEYSEEINEFIELVNHKKYRCCSWLKT
jgi:hypothetical protein